MTEATVIALVARVKEASSVWAAFVGRVCVSHCHCVVVCVCVSHCHCVDVIKSNLGEKRRKMGFYISQRLGISPIQAFHNTDIYGTPMVLCCAQNTVDDDKPGHTYYTTQAART